MENKKGKIIIGKTAGFCYGVKRAVEGAKKELENSTERVFCLGEIVHNKQVVEELKNEGITFIDDIKDGKNKTIIRAHGISRQIYEIANKKGINIIDYTCPKVLKIHEIAEKYSNEGYFVFLCGSKQHPENIGTISFCDKCYIIENEDDIPEAIEEFNKSKMIKLLVIFQTTYSLEKSYIIGEIIKNRVDKNVELLIKNTICKATEVRQKETKEISKKVDYMIIVGGKNSSNTKKLYDIARKNCRNSICIETYEQLNLKDIKEEYVIGIMAGASTPQKSIEEVYNKLMEYRNKNRTE